MDELMKYCIKGCAPLRLGTANFRENELNDIIGDAVSKSQTVGHRHKQAVGQIWLDVTPALEVWPGQGVCPASEPAQQAKPPVLPGLAGRWLGFNCHMAQGSSSNYCI